jgi:PRC-barrel domain protein
MIDKSRTQTLLGAELRAADGSKVGTIGQVYLDDYYDEPEWVTVNTGLFGTSESFVPLSEARIDDGVVTVPYSKDKIRKAPNISDSGHLSEAEERNLYDYYEIGYPPRDPRSPRAA